jgi:hypothetical protein
MIRLSQYDTNSRTTPHTHSYLSTNTLVPPHHPEADIHGGVAMSWDMPMIYDANAGQADILAPYSAQVGDHIDEESDERYVVRDRWGLSLIVPTWIGQVSFSLLSRHLTSTIKRTTRWPFLVSRAQSASWSSPPSHITSTLLLLVM